MHRIHTTLILVLLAPLLAQAAEIPIDAGPVDADGRPLIKKLGTVALDVVENSPVVFNGKLYLFMGRHKFHFIEQGTGRATPPFASGYFGNAFVDGDTMYVTVAGAGPQVRMYASKDLEHWQSSVVLDLPGFKIYNTSICKTPDKYVMMFEIGEPKEQAGSRFTARFATSKDLKQWTVTPPECVYTKARYSAPHCLRYLDGWFYNFYLEARPGRHYEMYVVRSKDLVNWELSPLNPVLRESADDRKPRNPKFTEAERKRIATAVNCNNSDLDFCEYKGRVVLFYSWGNQLGIEHLAEAVYEGSESQFLRGWFPKKPAAAAWPGTKSKWNGYDRHDFEFDGRKCWVVVPNRVAAGTPWIWRARFFGHEPGVDLALLAKGYHLVYIDVANLFGSPTAVAHWNAFYKYLTEKHGFAQKALLEGMSRGGLIVFNWAAANPTKVAAIYVDAPVCDFKSWPRGKDADASGNRTWQTCLKAYGLTDEQATAYKHNPIDNLASLAKARVPVLSVCGDADETVPLDENTRVVESRYRALGGPIRVIVKPGVGHHPHSLKDPTPIVEFLLDHTGR